MFAKTHLKCPRKFTKSLSMSVHECPREFMHNVLQIYPNCPQKLALFLCIRILPLPNTASLMVHPAIWNSPALDELANFATPRKVRTFWEAHKIKKKSSSYFVHLLGKVQLFWEGHKNLRTLPHGFDIFLVNVKTMRKIVQTFVAFSEKLNFKRPKHEEDFFKFCVLLRKSEL